MDFIKRVRDIKNSNFLASNTYNIRGWLTSINDPENLGGDLFGMKLSYNENIDGLTKKEQFNGNINAMVWNAKNYNQVQGYGFDYDGISRLIEADYSEKTASWNDLNKYTVDNLTYDQNGNIESLNREGEFNQIDALDYDYSGNQLVKVTDFATGADSLGFKDGVDLLEEYGYDANGNMVFDENKGIDTILYNYMNLPEVIYFGNATNENYLEYFYDPLGTKLMKYRVEGGVVTDSTHYIGTFIYNNDSLAFILTDEGKLTPDGTGNFQYEYFIKDHLGNNRVSFIDSSGVAVLSQEDHYYPFGMTMNGISYVNGVNESKYKYNGKELQDDQIDGVKLDWYDYGFRFYDPAIARWHVIDPAIENDHHNYTPYAYVYNNPMRFLDLFGLDSLDAVAITEAAENSVEWVTDKYGTVTAQCNRGVNHAFEELTGSDELAGVNANDMIDELESSDNFETIELDEVSEAANDGDIVIAGKQAADIGHVAMAVPGDEVTSTSWKGDVPVVMDTGGNKRTAKKAISYSWKGTVKDGISYYKYTGTSEGTINNRTYSGGTLTTATVTAKGSSYIKSKKSFVKL